MSQPKLALPMSKCENCPYNLFLYSSKNCYMCRGSSYLEDSFYCDVALQAKNSADSSSCKNIELCYGCLDSANLYNCDSCQDCRDCRDCTLCFECASCTDCFGCVGLRHKKFHILNEPYAPEAYAKKIQELQKKPWQENVNEFQRLKETLPHISMRGHSNENVTGDHASNCKNCHWCFGAAECEDCVYMQDEVYRCKDSVDITHSHGAELGYDLVSTDAAYNCSSCFWLEHCRDCTYSYNLISCSNCFMSAYLREKKFYILNEPYSESAYFEKVAEIKHWLKSKNLYGQNLIYLALKDTPEISYNL